MSNLPKLNSKWKSSNHVSFLVEQLEKTDAGIFVHYKRCHDNSSYSCLVEAFLSRFSEDATQ
jgi:hypothetical protein